MAVLRVGVLSGPRAGDVARGLRERDGGGLLTVTVVAGQGTAALVIGTTSGSPDERAAADAVLDDGLALAAQVDQLWSERIAPFARWMAGLTRPDPGPPVLGQHDPRLLTAAQRMLDRIRGSLARRGLADERWTYDHIGSTAVPGLRASPEGRRAYGQMKQQADGAHAQDADFDDYTRTKAAFFDQVRAEYERLMPQHGGA
jgi:dephospho-CoA kinase